MNLDDYLERLHDIDEHTKVFRRHILDCTWQEFRVLDLAAKEPDFCLSDYGHERSVYQQGVGRIAARLQKRGLLSVVVDDKDKRARNLVLTDKGLESLAKCRRVLSEVIN